MPRFALALAFAAVLALGTGSGSPSARAEAPVTIVAVNAPLAWMAERLAGEHARVVMPVPAGRDPAFWRPAVADIAAAQRADLILLNGAGYAAWTTKATLPRGRLVDTSAAFRDKLIATETVTHSHGAEGEHSHVGNASHVWLDFGLARAQAHAIAEALARRLPQEREAIETALAALEVELDALDRAAKSVGAALADRPLLASHPRFQYLARAYGLSITSLALDPDETPDETTWSALDALMAETGATAMLWERAPTEETAAALGERGIAIVVFEPGGDAAKTSFPDRMRANLHRLAALADAARDD